MAGGRAREDVNAAAAPVLFVGIARFLDRMPVAEFATPDARDFPRGTFEDKVNRVMRSGRVGESKRLTILDEEVGSIHYDSDESYVYIVFTERTYPQRAAFKLLGVVKQEFTSRFAEEGLRLQPLELNDECRPFLQSLCSEYSVAENVDKISQVKSQVSEVKSTMQKNIQSGLENQDKLEVLIDDSERMRQQADIFNTNANATKKKFWWQNMKLTLVIFSLVIVIILIIVLAVVFSR